MKSIQDEFKLFEQMITLISRHFGSTCEVVLHDLTKNYNSTIVRIANGHITDRTVGGCGSNLGLEVLRGTVVDGDRFNYVTHTPSGKILRSSSIYIKDDDGVVIGSICINTDITETVRFEDYLKRYNHYEVESEEIFVNDVGSLMDHLIKQAQQQIDKPLNNMSKDEKLEFISFLDQKGAFLVTKSGDKVCELLDISKFTLYNYLEITRKKKDSDKGKSLN